MRFRKKAPALEKARANCQPEEILISFIRRIARDARFLLSFFWSEESVIRYNYTVKSDVRLLKLRKLRIFACD